MGWDLPENNYQQGWKMTRTGEYDKMLFWLAEANIISYLCLHESEMCVIVATAQLYYLKEGILL